MTRGRQVLRRHLIPCAKALLALQSLIKAFAAEVYGEEDDDNGAIGMEPEDCWRPHLQLLTNIQEHVYTPANLSAGCRNVPHKNSGTAWQMHVDIPSGIPLDDHMDCVVSSTTDMGDEMSGPQFRVHQAALIHFACGILVAET